MADEWKGVFTGRMVMHLNAETLQEMKAKSRFEGHWRTRMHKIIKKKRLYRINLYMYNTDGDYEHDLGQLVTCGSMEDIWDVVVEMARQVIEANPDTEFDKERTKATIKA